MIAPHVLISPAMAIGSGYYRPLVAAFEEYGWLATALPRRGFGSEQQAASKSRDWSFGDEIGDIAAAVDDVRSHDPQRPVIVLGHSLGAQLAAGYQIQQPGCDGFVSIGSSIPYWRYYGATRWGLLAMALAIPLVTGIWGYMPKPFFGAPGARTLMRQWARFARTGVPPFPVADGVRTPTLDIHLEGDTYAVAPANDDFLRTLINPAVLTRWLYRHRDVPDGGTNHHIAWVRSPGPVVERIVTWWSEQNHQTVAAQA